MNIVQEGIPDVIPPEACRLGWQESLTLLAKLVEAEIPDLTQRGGHGMWGDFGHPVKIHSCGLSHLTKNHTPKRSGDPPLCRQHGDFVIS